MFLLYTGHMTAAADVNLLSLQIHWQMPKIRQNKFGAQRFSLSELQMEDRRLAAFNSSYHTWRKTLPLGMGI